MGFQISGALLDACVLAVLDKEDTYGYELTQKIKAVMDISESTLYPVLRRLKKEGFLTTYDKPYQGRNRRYYAISEDGKGKYKDYNDSWEQYKKQVDQLMCGGVQHE